MLDALNPVTYNSPLYSIIYYDILLSDALNLAPNRKPFSHRGLLGHGGILHLRLHLAGGDCTGACQWCTVLLLLGGLFRVSGK